jgi:hypothetical protein
MQRGKEARPGWGAKKARQTKRTRSAPDCSPQPKPAADSPRRPCEVVYLEDLPLAIVPISTTLVFLPYVLLALVPAPVVWMNLNLHTLGIVVTLDRVPAFSGRIADDCRRGAITLDCNGRGPLGSARDRCLGEGGRRSC